MFDDETCLILGAGASRPYGFPTSGELRRILLGEDLIEVIENLQLRDPLQVASKLEDSLLNCAARSPSALGAFSSAFRESERVSIDAFVAGLPNTGFNLKIKEIARRSIASVITVCEAHARLSGDWYRWLLEFLLRRGKDFSSGRLSVITFNYDRSFQYYFFRAFMRAFDLSGEAALEMLNRIEIIHVYGSLGSPRLAKVTDDTVPFGDEALTFQAAENLFPANPRVEPAKIERIHTLIDQAKRLIFLGFGFWTENLELLGAGSRSSFEHWHSKQVFASCYQLAKSTMIDVDDLLGYRAGRADLPLIDWGEQQQTVLDFVNARNLKRKA